MIKIRKAIIICCVVILTIVITVLPASANIIGDVRNSPKRAPFYLETLSFAGNPELTFNNNSYYPQAPAFYTMQLNETECTFGLAPVTYDGQTPDILGNNITGATGAIIFSEYNDQFPTTIDRFSFDTNTFVFEYAYMNDLANFPMLSFELENLVFDGPVSCVCYGEFLADGIVTEFSQEMSLPLLSENTFDITTASVYLTGLLDGGDIVSMRMSLTADVHYINENDEFGIFYSYDPHGARMIDSMVINAITEEVDVFTWLPSTVDTFLNIEFLPGLNFGTLLVMVIAIPALFAVLKMLGGGG